MSTFKTSNFCRRLSKELAVIKYVIWKENFYVILSYFSKNFWVKLVIKILLKYNHVKKLVAWTNTNYFKLFVWNFVTYWKKYRKVKKKKLY